MSVADYDEIHELCVYDLAACCYCDQDLQVLDIVRAHG